MASVFNSDEGIEDVFKYFVATKELIDEENPSIDIFDIDYFKARIRSLTEAFPEDFFLHALALKGTFLTHDIIFPNLSSSFLNYTNHGAKQ